MAVTNPSAPRSLASGRPFLVGFLVNVVIGYTVYFVALAHPEPPPWAISYIEQLKPTVKALDIAARISDRPFPAQVMILYAAISAVLLTLYFIYCAFFVTHIRQEFHRRLCERAQQLGVTAKLRLKFAYAGVFMLIISSSLFPMLFYILGQDPTNISWRAAAFFSPSIASVAFLLLVSGLTALAFVFGPWGIYASTCSFKSSKQTRS
jgi:preprotein translocase subunit SecY